MSRYIDADKLWNDRPQVTPEKSMDYKAGFSECMWAFSKLIREQIDNSTADVVPKSEYDAVVSAVDNSTQEFLKLHDDYQDAKREVERLEAELDDFTVASLAECKVCGEKTTKVIADLQKKLSNAKTEAASEIFAEIENNLSQITRPSSVTRMIAELKKKYTEGEG